MHGSYFSYALLAALAIALTIAAITDWRRREIDNWLNAAIAIGAPLFWFAHGFNMVDIGFQIVIATITFSVLLWLFNIGQMGGGDVKLLTALALWIQPLHYMHLLVVMSIAGGVLTLLLGGWHLYRKYRLHQNERIKVPYGIAISIAGLWVLADHHLPALQKSGLLG